MDSGIFLNRGHKNRDIGKDATTRPVDAEVPEIASHHGHWCPSPLPATTKRQNPSSGNMPIQTKKLQPILPFRWTGAV